MKTLRRLLLGFVLLLLSATAGFIVLVGPWPLYCDSNYQKASYFVRALAAIDTGALRTQIGGEVAPLIAGWAEREITPSGA
ncbi:MAG TPA: hypothetical protein ENN29_05025 [Candidatus Hydrogenedentes bacterium]|nr:hypothetical protein [Candidatus Hydrogenedentota bacterium]